MNPQNEPITRRRVLCVAAASSAVVALGTLTGCASSEASIATRRALLRHASFRGIEAKMMVGEPIDTAIATFGRPEGVRTVSADDPRRFNDIPVAGKDLYTFVRDRTNYTVDVARGTEIVPSSAGPVQVQRYERQQRTAICRIAFVVDPATRRIVAYDIAGNCV
jgi:hypothetical protein